MAYREHQNVTATDSLKTRLAINSRYAAFDFHEWVMEHLAAKPNMDVLDVGCGRIGLRALEPDLDITGVDLAEYPDYPGPFARADASEGLPFADGQFDLVYCSSVIEHVPPARRAAFAAEIRRVGKGWFVQTPAWSFPIEPHALLPGAHWLPPVLRRPYWKLGVTGGWEDISLLRRSEVETLFGPALPERAGPLVKSWVCVRPPSKSPDGYVSPPDG